MSPGRGVAKPRFRPLVAAAALAVAVAVASDLAVGGLPVHVATLGVVVAMVTALRWRMVGRHRGLLQIVSGCVMAQPALRVAAEHVSHGLAGPGVGLQIGHTDLVVTLVQLTVALAIGGTVSFAEQIVAAVTGIVRVYRFRIRSHVRQPGAAASQVRRAPAGERLTSRYRPGAIPRRGPPRRFAAAV